MERSMRWAARSTLTTTAPTPPDAPGGLFGIVQGGMHAPLRLASLEALLRLTGRAWRSAARVGEPEEERYGCARVAGAATCRPDCRVISWASAGRRTSWRP